MVRGVGPGTDATPVRLGAARGFGLFGGTGADWPFCPTRVLFVFTAGGPGAQALRARRASPSTVPAASDPGGYDAAGLGSVIRTAAWLDYFVNWEGTPPNRRSTCRQARFQASMTAAGYLEAGGVFGPEPAGALN